MFEPLSVTIARSVPVDVSSALNNYVKIKDVSHLPEVNLLMSIRPTLLAKYDEKYDNKNGLSVSISRRQLGYYSHYSIAGGYPRNILLGIEDAKTDVDVLAIDRWIIRQMLSSIFDPVPTDNESVLTFAIPGNTMHVLFHAGDVIYDENSDDIKHIFVNPCMFDFTINMGCISSDDGFLYAPPATLHDIQNKIVRANVQLNSNFDRSYLLTLPLCIRALRFTLKYDMSIHKDLYTAVVGYFTLSKERRCTDLFSMYHSLKHITEEPVGLRDELFMIMKKLGAHGTKEYSTFDEYFQYVKDNYQTFDRNNFHIECMKAADFEYR